MFGCIQGTLPPFHLSLFQKAAAQALSRVVAKAKDSPRAYFNIKLGKKKVYNLEI
jgi:hypothetical protein